MKQLIKLSLLIAVITLCGFTTLHKELKVTYVANCGFMYEANQSRVIIDPFGTQYGKMFYLPSDETKTSIIKGDVPFQNIGLLLITHVHGDHFNARLTEEFLINHQQAKMICPTQVYAQMKDSCNRFDKIKSQIICPNLAMYEQKELTVNGISVEVVRLQHGTNRSLEGVSLSDYTEYEKTENFGYIIHLGQKTIFHQGDGSLKLNNQALQKINCTINIAHLSFFDWDSTALNILKKDLKAEKIIFMHGTKSAKELKSEQFKSIAPQLLFFYKELESQTFF